MFEKTLADLIQGLRANKRNEREYIQQSLEEIQREVQSSDVNQKSAAVDKLNYLHMLGYDMNWANFHVVEVMASGRFDQKRAGYLAAAQSFHADTDVVMLTTNLIRKDLASSNAMEVAVALDGLAQIATETLAMDLLDDVMAVLGHTRAHIRKKAIVCLYRLVMRYPEGQQAAVPQLKERLEDADPAVVSAAVSVVCELARTNPHNYLALAPALYRLLNSSRNNWMLIKIVKLFALLTPIEPRLARKLHGPVSQLVSTTGAMSLLYECIHTAVVGDIIGVPLPATDSVGCEVDFAELCAQKLEQFYESRDHNLRYVGLATLAQLQARRPDLVEAQFETVLRCVDDPDLSIRMRALEVVSAMATRRTLVRSVKRLMSQLVLSNTVALQPARTAASTYSVPEAYGDDEDDEDEDDAGHPLVDASGISRITAKGTMAPKTMQAVSNAADNPEYRLAVIEAILDMCSRQAYANMADFEWYVATLVDLVYIAGVDAGSQLSQKLLDVSARVRQVRGFSVRMARRLLADEHLVEHAATDGINAPVLATAAFILGEYCSLLPATHDDIVLLLPRALGTFSAQHQAAFVQAAMKAYTNWLGDVCGYWSPDVWEQVRSTTASTQRALADALLALNVGSTVSSTSLEAELPLEVDGRLRQFVAILDAVALATSNPSDTAPPLCAELHSLFTLHELNPISAAAQAKVPLPEGLDLDTPIGEAIPDTSLRVLPPSPPAPPVRVSSKHGSHAVAESKNSYGAQENGVYYLGGGKHGSSRELPEVDDIPVVALDLGGDRGVPHRTRKKEKSKKAHKKKQTKSSLRRSPSPPLAAVDIAADEDMPGSADAANQAQPEHPAQT
ncbi:AP-3 complex subunit delta [Coemansia sp. RSA 1365]|nr:AP-3 complex subunit delta [Coemansia sp. RSA 1365]